MANTAESLVALLAALVIAALAMMLVARLMLGSLQAKTRITAGRYIVGACVTIGLLLILSLIPWPRGFDSLSTVAALIGLVYTYKLVLLPDTLPAEQWPRSVWMSVVTYVIFLLVNAGARAIFSVEPFSL